MTVGLWPGSTYLHREDGVLSRQLQSVVVTMVLLVLCSLVAACSLRTSKFELPPPAIANRPVYPWRVAVIADKEFKPYKIQFKYWSSPPFTWSLDGLPDAFVGTLKPHFLSVEPLPLSETVSSARHDLIARMAVDQLHFDGANTTQSLDTVDLTMTFFIERPDRTEVFRTTVSARASRPYTQPRWYSKPDPRKAFTDVFRAAFAKLSERLSVSEIEREYQKGLDERAKRGGRL